MVLIVTNKFKTCKLDEDSTGKNIADHLILLGKETLLNFKQDI